MLMSIVFAWDSFYVLCFVLIVSEEGEKACLRNGLLAVEIRFCLIGCFPIGFSVLVVEPRVFYLADKCYIIEIYVQPHLAFYLEIQKSKFWVGFHEKE